MRGTLHFVASEDLRWMLAMLIPRVIQRAAGVYKQAGLDNKIFTKSRKIFSRELRGGKQLTRNELYTALERSGISTTNQRGLHILGYLAQEGLICFGPRKGKQQTFVLLDDWIPLSNMLTREEGLARLTLNYFNSHGPATIQDFAWWSGLTIAEVKRSLEMVSSSLQNLFVNGQSYWMPVDIKKVGPSKSVFLLPTYDEYLVAYKNRSAAIDPGHLQRVKESGNGIFSSPVIIDGLIAGNWKRSLSGNGVSMETNLFSNAGKSITEAITATTRQFGKFIDRPVISIKTNV
jgi:DNA glycosylase AlkZ-like